MYYEYPITVSANTSASSPTEEHLKIAHGIIQHIDIQFLKGCENLARCRLDYHELLAFPADLTKYIAADGDIVHIEGPLEIYTAPYVFKATLWNLDDTYDHTITIRFDMVEAKETIMFARILTGLTKFLKVVGVKV